MKLLFLLPAAFLIQLAAVASDTTILFRQGSYADVFDLAKKENKAVLLYFHFDECGACRKMEQTTFVDKDVAPFYNANFVSFDINTRKGEGIETNKIYQVELHPTFLFLDANGKELHKIVGVFNPAEFISQARMALDPLNSLAYFRQQYRDGRRDAAFLFDYSYRLRDANELDSLVVDEYLATQDSSDLLKEQNTRYIYEFMLHHGQVFIPFQSPAYRSMLNNKSHFAKYFKPEQIDTRLLFVVMSEVYSAIERKDATSFWKTVDLLHQFDNGKEYNFEEMDGRITMWTTSKNHVLSAKMEFYKKTGDLQKHEQVLKEYIKTIWNDYNELNSIAWDYYENVEEKSKLSRAAEWAKRSIALNSNYANNDTYAALLYKLGKYDKALEYAEKAIKLAKEKEMDHEETSALIQKIKEKKPK